VKTEKLHCSNLSIDVVFARNGDRIWKASNDLQSIPEGCFKNTVRTALSDLCKGYNIGTRLFNRFGNDTTQLIYVEKESSLREAQMFIVTSDACKS
jgi:hypothetical protein